MDKQKSKLLVVDPDPYIGQYLKDLFARDGYDVIIEDTGRETIERALEHHPDLIILESTLPDKTGFQICNEIRNHASLHDIPVILMSPLHDRETRIKAIEAGADDFMAKPFDHVEMRLRIRTITRLDRYRKLLKKQEQIEELKRKEEAEKLEIIRKSERALRASKKHFENLAELSSVGIFSTDKDGKISYVNPKWQEIYSIQGKDAYKKHWLEFVNTQARPSIEANWKSFLQNNEQHFSTEHALSRNKGDIWIFVQLMAEMNLDDTLQGYVGTVTDLTERKRRESEIMKAVVETQESERKRFAEHLHDSVGQILSATKMYLNAIDSDTIDEGNLEMYEKARDLLSDAIAETRNISHDLMPSGIKEFGFRQSLKSILNTLSISRSIQVNFDYQISSHLPDPVMLGIYRMVQETTNNVIKHSEATHVSVRLHEDKQDFLLLTVSDDGKGFEPNRNNNEGIGLINLTNRVKYLSGKIHIDSTPGSGTEIHIKIPINQELV